VTRVEAGRAGLERNAVISAMEKANGYDLVCLSGVQDAGVLRAAVEQCEKRRAFLLIDLSAECDTAQEAKRWLSIHGELRHPNVAAYLPWVTPAAAGRGSRAIPPSGAMAGIIARTDRSHGVWRAPAGPQAELRGVTGLQSTLTDGEIEALTALGVNALRTLPDGRLVVWGARTLSADPEWRYVPVRRLFLFLEESISEGTEWAIFEPNEAPLWQALRAHTTAFMHSLFQQGAFQGASPQEAYFVKCGADTTTGADQQQGVCNIVVGFAPLRPAEFSILRIRQKTAAAG
jgi:phage tail sheath protein FI